MRILLLRAHKFIPPLRLYCAAFEAYNVRIHLGVGCAYQHWDTVVEDMSLGVEPSVETSMEGYGHATIAWVILVK